jgi:hypothetical protein
MARKDISDILVCRAYAVMHEEMERWAAAGCQPGTTFRRPQQILAAWTGEPDKVCWAAMERAFAHGLLDYGIGLHGGFLTAEGKALLATADTAARS